MEESNTDITTYFVPICFFRNILYFIYKTNKFEKWAYTMEHSLHRSPFQWNKNRNTHHRNIFTGTFWKILTHSWMSRLTMCHSSIWNIFQLWVKTSKYRLRRHLDWACHFDSYRLWENSNVKLFYHLHKSKKFIFVLFKILFWVFCQSFTDMWAKIRILSKQVTQKRPIKIRRPLYEFHNTGGTLF